MIKVTDQIVDHFIKRVEDYFPGWKLNGVDDKRFIETELDYKRKAQQVAQKLLNQEVFSTLLDDSDYQEIFNRLKKTATAGYNLLFLRTGKTGDLGILESNNISPESFSSQIFNLLHGGDELLNRVDGFIRYCNKSKLVIKWTFLTYYISLLHPKECLYVKPSNISAVLKDANLGNLWGKVSKKTYAGILEFASLLLEKLTPYGFSDLMEVQSFLWVVYLQMGDEEWQKIYDLYLEIMQAEEEGEEVNLSREIKSLARSAIRWKEAKILSTLGNISFLLHKHNFKTCSSIAPIETGSEAVEYRFLRILNSENFEEFYTPFKVNQKEREAFTKSFENVLVEPPSAVSSAKKTINRKPLPPGYDFAQRDKYNRELGQKGEMFVLEYEKNRLQEINRPDLAEKVQWSSKEIGDGLGYDIQSFDEEGNKVFIEVKTTNGYKSTSFLITQNEVEVSEEIGAAYRLYRVFSFKKNPRLYILKGPLFENCLLEPRSFSAKPKQIS